MREPLNSSTIWRCLLYAFYVFGWANFLEKRLHCGVLEVVEGFSHDCPTVIGVIET